MCSWRADTASNNEHSSTLSLILYHTISTTIYEDGEWLKTGLGGAWFVLTRLDSLDDRDAQRAAPEINRRWPHFDLSVALNLSFPIR